MIRDLDEYVRRGGTQAKIASVVGCTPANISDLNIRYPGKIFVDVNSRDSDIIYAVWRERADVVMYEAPDDAGI